MIAIFNSGEMADCAYAEALEDNSMFLTLENKTMLEAAALLASVDLSKITVTRLTLGGETVNRVFEGYINVDYITTEAANARARLRREAQ